MKKLSLFFVLALATVVNAEPRTMESVLNISVDNAAILLGGDDGIITEEVLLINYTVASQLLGDDDMSSFNFDDINSMPATAAGNNDIIYINADAAETLLGTE